MSITYKNNVVSLCEYRKERDLVIKESQEINNEKMKAWMDFFFSSEDPFMNGDLDLESFTFTIDLDSSELDTDE